MLTGPQCRAARALVELSRDQLAGQSGLETRAIEAFERKLNDLGDEDKRRLRQALEIAGAVFIPENGGGLGVRLKFSRSDVRRIATLEGEGGIIGADDVP